EAEAEAEAEAEDEAEERRARRGRRGRRGARAPARARRLVPLEAPASARGRGGRLRAAHRPSRAVPPGTGRTQDHGPRRRRNAQGAQDREVAKRREARPADEGTGRAVAW